MTIRKRSLVRLLSFSFALSLVFGGIALTEMRQAGAYRLLLNAASGRALAGLSRSLSEVQQGLTRGLTYHSPSMLGQSALELATAASGGRAALDCLPLSAGELNEVGIYLSQLVDYAAALQREAVGEDGLSADSRERLRELLSYAKQLSDEICGAEEEICAGRGEMDSLAKKVQEDGRPALFYDGLYSAHMLETPLSAALNGAEEVTCQQAKQIAATLLSLEPDKLELAGESTGPLAAWRFQKDGITVSVTKAGGRLLSLVNDRELAAGALDPAEALRSAAEFLSAQGYSGMTPISHEVTDALVTACFAFEKENVLFYPDCITLAVAREGGDLVGFSAAQYLLHHDEDRSVGAARLGIDAAQGYLPKDHSLESARYAVIASPGGVESLALELTTSQGEDRYLYYLDAQSAEELKLSRLREDETGRRID
jgi:hypothetical protein